MLDERMTKTAATASRTLAVICVVLFLGGYPTNAFAEIDAKTFDAPKPVPEFSLRDHKGDAFGRSQLDGQWSLVLLGYTHCPDVCPFTLGNIALVIEQLGFRVRPGGLPNVIFVGVDPDRDAEVIPDYITNFHDDFIGITGDWSEVKRLVEGVDGFVRLEKKSPDDDGYTVRHSANVLVIDPQGRVAASMNPPFEPNEAADFLANLFRKERQKMRATN